MNKSYITCPECGTINLNAAFCSNCGALLDVVARRKLERELEFTKKAKLKASLKKEPSKIETFLKNGTEHSNVLIRLIFQGGYYIWLFFALIFGALISLIVAAAAG
ncbi:zinc ribbon domain-containing protein [Flavobacterium sp. 14A]|uniref:zinc ribbon domain-containing protein n=1 Tax=Flavobacterium sp. 14A TaxID=2735896 RepID=UPI00157140F0|nr:zinc ribbon domain-containing protein [Flavobacterium sp. 14A]NRT13005.1 DNA-directed RNA polymerase subunit RPC12/RpoP [Flavobacterium sp. 14A]